MLRQLPLFVTAITMTAASSLAQYSVTGPGGVIPATPAGSTGAGTSISTALPTNFTTSALTAPVPANAANITSVKVSGLTHTWAGDLQVVLWNPSLTTGYNMLARLGGVGANGVGHSCDFGGDITFVKAGDPSINQTWPAVNPGAAVILPAGIYAQNYNLWVSGSASVNNTDIASIPVTPGTWTLIIYDGAGGDVGTFTGWTLAGDTVVPPVAPTKMCAGDGTGTACPCGNSGAATNGCANSASAAGASLVGSGTPSIVADTLVLTATGCPTNAPILYAQGTANIAGGAGAVFNDGLGCVGGTTIRLGTKISVAGSSAYPSGSQAISTRGANAPGNTRFYQGVFRDVAPYCTPVGVNQTNGVQLTWGT